MDTNTTIKAVIIDDEEGCIINLKYYLSSYCPSIEIIATGKTIEQAKEILYGQKFDVAFLDIELFDENIFNAIDHSREGLFNIVFVTAHEQYAVKAIKFHAFDYILKPLSKHEVLECYAKLKKYVSKKTLDIRHDSSLFKENNAQRKIILKEGDKIFVIRVEDVYYMRAKGPYTLVTFNSDDCLKQVTISKPLNQVEKENINNKTLYRAHKSYLVNIEKIKSIIKHNGLSIQMRNDEIIPIAKRRVPDFLSFLNDAD